MAAGRLLVCVMRPHMQGSIQLISPLQNILILPPAVQYVPLFRPSRCRNSFQLVRGAVMSDTIRMILTLILFLIAFPALYIFLKAADPHLKAIVGAAVFLFPCFLLLWEDLVREKHWLASARKRLSDLGLSVWPQAHCACQTDTGHY
jgi:hypothetical protein